MPLTCAYGHETNDVYWWGRKCPTCAKKKDAMKIKIDPMLDSGLVSALVPTPFGDTHRVMLSSAEARAIAEDLVRAANWVCHAERSRAALAEERAKVGIPVMPEITVDIEGFVRDDVDEINRQLDRCKKEANKLGYHKRMQQEQAREEQLRRYGTVRVKPEAVKSFDEETSILDQVAVAKSEPDQKCVKCGKDQHDGWCWL